MFAVQGVCKTYQGHQVLSPVSFVLPEGQCLGVAGSNGSGKSTLLRILAQIQPPDKGDILFDGESVLMWMDGAGKWFGFDMESEYVEGDVID